jgi:hypothetical protein
MKLWKALGVAGLAGVAATGVILARDRRQRAQLTPEEIRARLHERVAEAEATREAARDEVAGDQPPSTESSARA